MITERGFYAKPTFESRDRCVEGFRKRGQSAAALFQAGTEAAKSRITPQ